MVCLTQVGGGQEAGSGGTLTINEEHVGGPRGLATIVGVGLGHGPRYGCG